MKHYLTLPGANITAQKAKQVLREPTKYPPTYKHTQPNYTRLYDVYSTLVLVRC